MDFQTATQLLSDYKNHSASVTEVVRSYLDQISKHDPKVKAFITVFGEEAEREAKASDDRYHKQIARPLEGIPIAIKDNLCLKGSKTTAASSSLENYHAVYTATAVQRLKDAGAIIIGKTNCDEFAMGASTEHSAFFETTNPHNHHRVPGGSSGGSAAAVAADMCAIALGSDTGGSVRQPASFCGVVGYKPTYGRVSRFGLIAMCSSLDQIGPLARSVDDTALLYSHIAGTDAYDSTTFAEKPDPLPNISLRGLTVGIPESFLSIGIDEAVRDAFNERVALLEKAGAKIVQVDLTLIKYALPVYYLLVTSEVSSNLARYDGMRYGTHADGVDNLLAAYEANRSAGFGDEAKRRILLGTFTLSKGYRDAYYVNALRVKKLIEKEMHDTFTHIDALACPTSPTVAFALHERLENPLTMYLSDLFTVPANIANLPAISLPAGTVHDLPFGFQLMSAKKSDSKLLAIAKACEGIFGAPKPVSFA